MAEEEVDLEEEVYETDLRGKVTSEQLKDFEDFEKKLQALFQEHGYGVGVYYLMKPIDPDWLKDVGTIKWGMVHGVYNSDEILTAIRVHSKGLKETPDDPTKNMTKEELHIMYEANMAVSSMFNRSVTEAYSVLPNVMALIEQIKEALGLDKARMIPIKCNTRYFVYTITGVKYLMSYDDEFKFSLKRVEGGKQDPPDDPLRFVGMVQKSGNIFHRAMDLPIVSTGDKMVFSKHGTQDICFITGEIRDVQQVENLN